MDAENKIDENGDREDGSRYLEEGGSENYLASCMHMTWFCVMSQMKT